MQQPMQIAVTESGCFGDLSFRPSISINDILEPIPPGGEHHFSYSFLHFVGPLKKTLDISSNADNNYTMQSEAAILLDEIKAHCKRIGKAPSTFCKRSVGNSELPRRVENGGSVSLETAKAIRKIIAKQIDEMKSERSGRSPRQSVEPLTF